jgi:hypothetical protein
VVENTAVVDNVGVEGAVGIKDEVAEVVEVDVAHDVFVCSNVVICSGRVLLSVLVSVAEVPLAGSAVTGSLGGKGCELAGGSLLGNAFSVIAVSDGVAMSIF